MKEGHCHEVFQPGHPYLLIVVSREMPMEPVPRSPEQELPVQLLVYLVMPVEVLPQMHLAAQPARY